MAAISPTTSSVSVSAFAPDEILPPFDPSETDYKIESSSLELSDFPVFDEPDQIEFTKRIPKNRMAEIQERINPLVLTPQMIEAFTKGIWSDEIFKTSNWTDYAFKAYCDGKITCSTFQKLCLFYDCQFTACLTACNQHQPFTKWLISCSPQLPCYETLQLFDGASINERSKKIFFEAFFRYYSHTNEQLARLKFEEFLKFIIQIDPLKTQFFLVPRNNSDPLFNVLVFRDRNGDRSHLFGTIGLDQTNKTVKQVLCLPVIINLIQTIFRGNQAKLGKPCLGFFHKEKLSDPIYRAVYMPFPLSKKMRDFGLPRSIDGFAFQNPSTISHHDLCYHILIESQIPLAHRKAFNDFAEFIKQLSTLDAAFKKDIRFYLLDKNFADYRRCEPPMAFWKTLLIIASEFWERSLDHQFLSLIPQFFTLDKLTQLSIPLSSLEKEITSNRFNHKQQLQALYQQSSGS